MGYTHTTQKLLLVRQNLDEDLNRVVCVNAMCLISDTARSDPSNSFEEQIGGRRIQIFLVGSVVHTKNCIAVVLCSVWDKMSLHKQSSRRAAGILPRLPSSCGKYRL